MDEPSATQEGGSVPWLRMLISVVGTIVLAAVVGVPFPGEGATAVIAAAGAFWVGRRTFRKITLSHPGNRFVAVVASLAVAAAAFVALFFVVLFVWMILWLETTPM